MHRSNGGHPGCCGTAFQFFHDSNFERSETEKLWENEKRIEDKNEYKK